MPLQRLSNSHSKDYSWVKIGVRMAEISWKLGWRTDCCTANFQGAITFNPIVGFLSSRSIQRSQDQPDKRKIKAGGHWKAVSGLTMAVTSIFATRTINSLRHAPDKGDRHCSEIFPSTQLFSTFFLYSKHQKHLKNTSKFLDSCISTKNTMLGHMWFTC